jgi:hypothetical protein
MKIGALYLYMFKILMKTNNIKFFLLFTFIFLSCGIFKSVTEENDFRFSLAQKPIYYSPEKEDPPHPKTGLAMKTADDCKTCHETIYNNWSKSRHKVAFTNPLYKKSHEEEPLSWCVNCHAPLLSPEKNPNNLEDRHLSDEGIGCHVCHVRNQKILVPKLPEVQNKNTYSHQYQIINQLNSSEFCANCHQFNFPKLEKSNKTLVVYSNLEMQNTYKEYLSTELSKHGNCQDCHLSSRSEYSHLFPGGHDAKKLEESIHIELERVGINTLLVKIITIGIAHSFPTGDLFRTLKVNIFDTKKNFINEIVLRKTYSNTASFSINDLNLPSRILIKDNRVPPPLNGYSSLYQESIHIPSNISELEFELKMDYLNPSNRFQMNINENETYLIFKRLKITIPKFEGESG